MNPSMDVQKDKLIQDLRVVMRDAEEILKSSGQQLGDGAALAPHVDGAISKILSVPEHTTPREIETLIHSAWRLGLAGISLFRRGSRPGVLVV